MTLGADPRAVSLTNAVREQNWKIGGHLVLDHNDAIDLVAGTMIAIRVETIREAMAKIQADCSACNGSGCAEGVVPNEPAYQCEYCGRPMAAIQGLLR